MLFNNAETKQRKKTLIKQHKGLPDQGHRSCTCVEPICKAGVVFYSSRTYCRHHERRGRDSNKTSL